MLPLTHWLPVARRLGRRALLSRMQRARYKVTRGGQRQVQRELLRAGSPLQSMLWYPLPPQQAEHERVYPL